MRLRVGYAPGQAECSQARGPGLVWFQGLALGAKHHSAGTGLIEASPGPVGGFGARSPSEPGAAQPWDLAAGAPALQQGAM